MEVKPFVNFTATECKLIMKEVFVNGFETVFCIGNTSRYKDLIKLRPTEKRGNACIETLNQMYCSVTDNDARSISKWFT